MYRKINLYTVYLVDMDGNQYFIDYKYPPKRKTVELDAFKKFGLSCKIVKCEKTVYECTISDDILIEVAVSRGKLNCKTALFDLK